MKTLDHNNISKDDDWLKLAAEMSHIGYWKYDLISKVISWSNQTYIIHGIAKENFTPTLENIVELYHPNDHQLVMDNLVQSVKEKESFVFEARIITPNNVTKHVKYRGQCLLDEVGAVRALYGTIDDVTQSKNAKDAYKRNEQQLKATIDYGPIGKALVSPKGEWLRVNEALCSLLGYTEKELLAINYQKITHPEDLPKSLQNMSEILDKKYNSYQTRKRYMHKKGHIIYTLLTVSLVRDENDQPLYFISEIQDISKLMENQEKLAASERRLELSLKGADLGLWDWDIKSGQLFRNERWSTMFGYEPSEIKPYFKSWEKLLHPSDKKKALTALQNHLDGKSDSYETEVRVKTKTGKWVRVLTSGKVVERDSKGKAIRVVGTLLDITEKVKTFNLLHLLYTFAADTTLTTNEKINKVLEATLEYLDLDLAIISKISDGTMKLRYVQPAGEVFYPGAILDLQDTYCLYTFSQDGIQATINTQKHAMANPRCFARFKINSYIATQFKINNRKYGTVCFSSQEKRKAFTAQEKTIVELVSQWCSSQINSENQIQALIKSETNLETTVEKLSESNTELGRFAFIASHDLQEPLRSLISLTELLRKKYGERLDDTANQYLNYMVEAASNMKNLVVDLLEYSRVDNQKVSVNDEVNTNKALEYVLQNLQEDINSNKAKITYHKLPIIRAQSLRFISLMQNLISNAIKYRRPNVNPIISITANELEEYWQFCIEDNGIGIDQDYYKLIFEPFKRLEDKRDFAGTGIGLAICKKIVSQFGGKIWVKSKVGKSTKFFFTVPK